MNYDVIEVNWDSTLVAKTHLKNASKSFKDENQIEPEFIIGSIINNFVEC